MKTIKTILFSAFLLTGLSATASDTGCLKEYKLAIAKNSGSAVLFGATGFGVGVAGVNVYFAHQSRKMYELLKESISGKIGKRTKSMRKSLNYLSTHSQIQKAILEMNRKGVLCEVDKGLRELNPGNTVSYRSVKDIFRLQIDYYLVKQGKKTIWNERHIARSFGQ